MIKVKITNEILHYISQIEANRYKVSSIELPKQLINKLRKVSKKKSSYASNKIEGNPLSEEQADSVMESDGRKHHLRPEQELINYISALNYLEEQKEKKVKFSKQLILHVQKLVINGVSKEKVGLRGAMPPGVLFAVYDSKTGTPEYIPPDYNDVPSLLDELVEYVNTTDDHPLIVAAMVHYQLVTIHPFEDGNGRTARLLAGYMLDLNGFGFNGVGSLEEYFAYDIDEYYASIQMGLPVLYYMGRNDPPNFEIWINYFLRMVLLYSTKICELSDVSRSEFLTDSLSVLKIKEKGLLFYILKNCKLDFSPIELANALGVSNRTIINRLVALVRQGFIIPNMQKERVRTYKLSELSKVRKREILKVLKVTVHTSIEE